MVKILNIFMAPLGPWIVTTSFHTPGPFYYQMYGFKIKDYQLFFPQAYGKRLITELPCIWGASLLAQLVKNLPEMQETPNKASRGDGIPVKLFQILKDAAVTVLQSICQQIWKLSKGHSVMPKLRNLPMTTREPISDAKAKEFLLPSWSWGSHCYWRSGYRKEPRVLGYIAYIGSVHEKRISR